VFPRRLTYTYADDTKHADLWALNITSNLTPNSLRTASNCRIAVAVGAISMYHCARLLWTFHTGEAGPVCLSQVEVFICFRLVNNDNDHNM